MAEETFVERKHVIRWSLLWVVFFAAFVSMSYGASNAIISTTIGQPSWYRAMELDEGQKYYHQRNALLGATSSLFYAGGFFGPFVHGWVADAYGRKMSMFVACATVLVSQACITGAASIGMFIAFRFFAGWGAYHCVAAAPNYITEIVPPRDRGMLTDIHAVGINVAYVVTGYIGLGFFFFDSADAWRGPLSLTMIPPLVVCIGVYWLPESPRWLLSQGREEEAWNVLSRLHRDPTDANNEFARREYYQIRKQIELDRTLPATYREIFTRPSYRKRAIITVTLLFCVMSSGILVIQNYGVIIFGKLGFDNVQQLLFQTGYTANCLLWSVIAMTFVDRVSRTRLLGTGYGMCAFFLTMLTILLSIYEKTTNRAGLAACVAMIFLYNVSFELGLDGPEFFYQAEIWPSHLRAKGYALATCVYSGINIVWLQAAPTAFATIGYYYYIIFIVCSVFGSLMAFFYFPDTLHKPLEEVAALFGDQDLVVVYQQQLGDSELGDSIKEKEAHESEKDEMKKAPSVDKISNADASF